ncbi:MAG TPA: hypothetical protein VMU66_03125 [Gaiellales bacterium]|nr:hypothetical protein [Gaiellales bacterium]
MAVGWVVLDDAGAATVCGGALAVEVSGGAAALELVCAVDCEAVVVREAVVVCELVVGDVPANGSVYC